MKIGVIGGSGLARLKEMTVHHRELVRTPYGEPSAPVTHGLFGDLEVAFLPRHGSGHRLPPHSINYRANIEALKSIGIEQIIGLATVGGITAGPEALVIPDQIIDYTYGREHTFFDGHNGIVHHEDFTEPFCEELRQRLITAAKEANLEPITTGVYGATQGPRLETAAEIVRLERDGCDIVGMTAMPEAALAREAGLCYASSAVVVNWGAGKGEGAITSEVIEQHLAAGLDKLRALLLKLA